MGDAGTFTGDSGAFTGEAGALTGDAGALIGEVGAFGGDATTFVGDAGALIGDSAAFVGDNGALIGETGALIGETGNAGTAVFLGEPGSCCDLVGLETAATFTGDCCLTGEFGLASMLFDGKKRVKKTWKWRRVESIW